MGVKFRSQGFKKALKGLEKDLNQIQVAIVNDMANACSAVAKQNTPVGFYPSTVRFTTKDGREVEFEVSPKTGGTLRRRWRCKYASIKKVKTVAECFNNTEYALYVNNGHRIVDKQGNTIGYQKGLFMLVDGIKAAKAIRDKRFSELIRKAGQDNGFSN